MISERADSREGRAQTKGGADGGAAITRRSWPFFLLLLLCGLAATTRAGDWPQFRGPNGDGTTTERIRTDWPAGGPKRLWRTSLTNGFSSVAVSQGKVVTQVTQKLSQGTREVVVGLDAENGRILWGTPLPPIKSTLYDSGGNEGDGPRSTPAIKNGRVYVLSSWLVLACLDLSDGHVIWSKDLMTLYGGRNISWQNAASPCVEGDLVLVNCDARNQTLLALRAADGEKAWQTATEDRMTHATPVPTTLFSQRQVVFYAQSGLVSVNPTNGAVLWRQATSYNNTSVAASPVVASNLIYASAAYGTGARVVRLTKPGSTITPTQILRTPGDFQNHWVSPVHFAGYLYMIEGSYAPSSPLVCVKLDTLEAQWSQENFGHAGGIIVADKLLMLTETGALVLIDPTPAGYSELARFQAVAGKCWNVPAVSSGRIYVRSIKEVAAFDVALPPPPPVRLAPPIVRQGKLELRLANVDGNPIDPARTNQIDVLSSNDPASPLANWSRLAGPWVWDNGTLRLETTIGAEPKRCFITLERP